MSFGEWDTKARLADPATHPRRTARSSLLARLEGGDRRSIGRANEVAAEVLARPTLFPRLFAGLTQSNMLVRIRAADAIEKISASCPELLAPFKAALLGPIADATESEVRWHVAQMIPRLPLSASERRDAVALLVGWLGDRSSILKTCAMQALAELAVQDRSLRAEVTPLIERLTRSGTPAMKARGKRLAKLLAAAGHGLKPSTRQPPGP